MPDWEVMAVDGRTLPVEGRGCGPPETGSCRLLLLGEGVMSFGLELAVASLRDSRPLVVLLLLVGTALILLPGVVVRGPLVGLGGDDDDDEVSDVVVRFEVRVVREAELSSSMRC